MEYIAEFHNADTNMTGLVYPLRGGFAAALRDDDSGMIAPPITIYPDIQRAKAEAERIANK